MQKWLKNLRGSPAKMRFFGRRRSCMKLSCFGQTQTHTHTHTNRHIKKERRQDMAGQTCRSLADLQQLQNFLATRSVIQCFLLSRLGLIIFSFLICIFNLIRMRLYAAQQSLCPCGCSSCKLNTRTHRHNITKNVDVWWLAKKKKKNTKKISESLLIYICLILDL